ncbi:MAG: PcfJ domain-containing protein [Bacteroidia bacterium]|nr:PcfJ domain-containing protein [Bacteroidia bacterium]
MKKKSKLKIRLAETEEKEKKIELLLKTQSRKFDPANFLSAMINGNKMPEKYTFPNEGYRYLYTIFADKSNSDKNALGNKQNFFRIVSHIAKGKGSEMLKDSQIINALQTAAKMLSVAVRTVESWKPASHNKFRMCSEFIQHLFVEYKVSTFMYNAFYTGNKVHLEWFMLIARGESLRKKAKFPLNLSARGVHFFLNAPDDLSIEEALRYAQVTSMGGRGQLLRAILGTFIGPINAHESFWETVILFFVNNPMLDIAHIGPIVDFINAMKYEARNVFTERGVMQRLPPPLPDFCMKGRTVSSLLRMVDEWHTELALMNRKKRIDGSLCWEGIPISDFEHSEGKGLNERKYKIRQLITYKELLQEGNAMSHCVFSYADSCAKHKCSIWSVLVESVENVSFKRLLTIELSSSKAIVQVKGKYNACPTSQEMRIIELWAKKEGLSISRWVTTRD